MTRFAFGFYTAALSGALLTNLGDVSLHDVCVSLSLAGLAAMFVAMACAPLAADTAPRGSGVAGRMSRNPSPPPDHSAPIVRTRP